jgi:hypothetical protein
MPTPPSNAGQLRLQQDLPRPFVIEPPGLDPDQPVTPEGLTFRLMLFGTAIDRLPYLISTLDRLGFDGLGRDRTPFHIERITACHPAGDEILFTGGSNTVSLPQRVITTDDLLTPPSVEKSPDEKQLEMRRRVLMMMGQKANQTEPVPSSSFLNLQPLNIHPTAPSRPRLKLKFLTPLLLKSGSGIGPGGQRISAREIRERPPLGVIVRRLRDRLSSLCTFFGDGWDCPNFAALGELADSVRLIDSRTVWLTRNRRSTRTGQAHEISGLVGQATYEFPDKSTFATLLPLLQVGELIHVGKNAPWGNGAVRGVMLGEQR